MMRSRSDYDYAFSHLGNFGMQADQTLLLIYRLTTNLRFARWHYINSVSGWREIFKLLSVGLKQGLPFK